MTLLAPTYRNDYIGENINGYNTEGEPYSIFVPPRPNVFIQPSTSTAIVLGNGRSKNIDQVKYLLEINSKKSAEGYKLVYACNKAINDDMAYDYYVLRHRVFMSNISQPKPQVSWTSLNLTKMKMELLGSSNFTKISQSLSKIMRTHRKKRKPRKQQD